MIPDYIDEVERPNEETIAAMLEAERIAKDPNVSTTPIWMNFLKI